MGNNTSIICIKCDKQIKKNEGFIPCKADKTKMYNPKKKRFVLQSLSH